MKVSFYKVYAKDFIENKVSNINVKKEIDEIIINQIPNSKEFISHVIGDVYIFVKINDYDLIKKINKNNLSVQEIQSILNKNEGIGFSSYFIVKDNIIGYGPTILSSKINRLSDYINMKLQTNVHNDIIFEPICKNVTKADALKLNFIGKTTFRIEANNHLGAELRNFFGLGNVDEDLLNEIEITIKPNRGRNIKKLTKKLITNYYSEIDMLKIKAKDEISEQAVELYVADNILCDFIDHKKAESIPFLMENCFKKRKDAIIRLTE